MGQSVSALDVARYFLYKANREGDLITNLKLQKLLYYAQAWYLVHHKEPLFKETIRAWALGPVVREVYDEYKNFGASPISYSENGKEKKPFTVEQLQYLDEFYDAYFGFTAHELVNMTHNERPWVSAHRNSANISHSSMKQYYTEVLQKENGK